MRLIALGTGHGNVDPERFQTSWLLEAGESRLLLDAGEPCAQRLRAIGIAPGSLDAVLISHAHADHIGGLALLMQAVWGDGRDTPLPIHLPAHAGPPVSDWLDFTMALLPERPGFGFRLLSWPEPCITGSLQISVHPTTHLKSARLRDPSVEAFAMDIRHGSARTIFSGDIGSPGDLQPLLTLPTDLLICELSHIDPDDLMSELRGCTIGSLILTHVAERFLSDRQKWLEKFQSTLGFPVGYAEEGHWISL